MDTIVDPSSASTSLEPISALRRSERRTRLRIPLEVGWTEKEMRREMCGRDARGADGRRKDENERKQQMLSDLHVDILILSHHIKGVPKHYG